MTVTYTTAAKVRQLIMGNTAGLLYITDATIETFINRAEDWIDSKTNHAWREKVITERIHPLGNEWRYSVLEGKGLPLKNRQIRPFRAGVAGSATTSTTTTLIYDTANLGTGAWTGYYLTFTNGPNEGMSRLISAHDTTAKTVTVSAFPYTPAVGNTYFIGDGFEVWSGSAWENWVLTKTMSHTGDFWLDPDAGIIYVKTIAWFTGRNAVRITYRYGANVVDLDIERAATMLAACEVVDLEGLRSNMPGGESLNVMSPRDRIKRWTEEAEAIIARHVEWKLIGS